AVRVQVDRGQAAGERRVQAVEPLHDRIRPGGPEQPAGACFDHREGHFEAGLEQGRDGRGITHPDDEGYRPLRQASAGSVRPCRRGGGDGAQDKDARPETRPHGFSGDSMPVSSAGTGRRITRTTPCTCVMRMPRATCPVLSISKWCTWKRSLLNPAGRAPASRWRTVTLMLSGEEGRGVRA